MYLFSPNNISHPRSNVTFLGDAKNGRTMHSLVKLLAKMLPNAVVVRYATPEELRMPTEVSEPLQAVLEQHDVPEMTEAVLAATDVLYVTRVGHMRLI
jgi:aspartate carbamoyltransferase catalytic subunit